MAAPIENMLEKKVAVSNRSGASIVVFEPKFSHDSKFLFCSGGNSVKVYSTISGECVRNLIGHRDLVTSVYLSSKNKLQLYTSSLDQTVCIWDYQDGIQLKEYRLSYPVIAVLAVFDEDIFVLCHTGHYKYDIVRYCPKNNSSKVALAQVSSDARHSAVHPQDRSVCAIKNKALHFVNLEEKENHKHTVEQNLTCVAFHPTENCVVTGGEDGKIYYWWNLGSSKKVVKSVYHWHSLPVLHLKFTAEGSYLLSGGHECVLVKWQFNSTHRDFLPRLGAPICFITCSPDNQMYATCHHDNVINLISNKFKLLQVYQGLTVGHLVSQVMNPAPCGIMYDPRTKALVTNGKPGHLQFYSVENDKQLYNLDIVCENYISPENLKRPTVVTEITNAAFSSDGSWLATVQLWDNGVMSPELILKFWFYQQESQSFMLNTLVDSPHTGPVSCLKFRPLNMDVSPTAMVVTSSQDGKFKCWTLNDDTDIYRENSKWMCESVGYYRDRPAGATSFAEDGSVLAVVFGPVITLWNPDSNVLRKTLVAGPKAERVRATEFGHGSCCHYLVSSSDHQLIVWDLRSCSVTWSVELDVYLLISDPLTENMAVTTEDQTCHGAMVGCQTRKVVDYCVKSKNCRTCDNAYNKTRGIPDHDCRKNWTGSAKAMEPAMAVEMLQRITTSGVKVSKIVMDDDSSTIARIRSDVDSGIVKCSDRNHTFKSFSNTLYNLQKDKNYKNVLSTKVIKHIGKCFSYAVTSNKGSPDVLRQNLLAVVPHLYGDHQQCSISWCKYLRDPETYIPRNLPYSKYLSNSNLRTDLDNIFKRYAEQAEKLARLESTQVNENFNQMVAVKNPKSKFYSGSESTAVRVAAAVCQKNIGPEYVLKTNEKLFLSPGEHTKKHTEQTLCKRKRNMDRQKTREAKICRIERKSLKCSKSAASETREGVTYQTMADTGGFSQESIEEIPPPPPKPSDVTLPPSQYTRVYFDLETTGLVYIFKPSDPEPFYIHKSMCDEPIVCGAFLPLTKKRDVQGTQLHWQLHSQLYLLTLKQKLLSLVFEDEAVENKSYGELKLTSNLPQTPFSLLMSKDRKSGVRESEKQSHDSLPSGKFTQELIMAAPHTQPHVSLLCNKFIQSLLIQKKHNGNKEESPGQDEYESESESADKHSSDSDSEMEVDDQVTSRGHQGSKVVNSQKSDTSQNASSNTKDHSNNFICSLVDKEAHEEYLEKVLYVDNFDWLSPKS